MARNTHRGGRRGHPTSLPLPEYDLPDIRAGDPSAPLEAEELSAWLRERIATALPVSGQFLVTLRLRHPDWGWEEIGAKLGITGDAAKKRYACALRRLRTAVRLGQC